MINNEGAAKSRLISEMIKTLEKEKEGKLSKEDRSSNDYLLLAGSIDSAPSAVKRNKALQVAEELFSKDLKNDAEGKDLLI